jgi:hypothetical protein
VEGGETAKDAKNREEFFGVQAVEVFLAVPRAFALTVRNGELDVDRPSPKKSLRELRALRALAVSSMLEAREELSVDALDDELSAPGVVSDAKRTFGALSLAFDDGA